MGDISSAAGIAASNKLLFIKRTYSLVLLKCCQLNQMTLTCLEAELEGLKCFVWFTKCLSVGISLQRRGTGNLSVFQLKEQSTKEIKSLVQGHSAVKLSDCDAN